VEDDMGNDVRRIRFYGSHDLAAGFHLQRVGELALSFDPGRQISDVVDAIELYNVQQYLENAMFPPSSTPEERDRMELIAPKIRSAVARFFNGIDSSNFADVVAMVGYAYHADLLCLLGRGRVFERCDGHLAIQSLKAAGVHLIEMLANRSLVDAYDRELRDELVATPLGGEYLIRRYLEKDTKRAIHVPSSFTSADSRDILARYIDHKDANLNYVRYRCQVAASGEATLG
jgi:hypothetical protein